MKLLRKVVKIAVLACACAVAAGVQARPDVPVAASAAAPQRPAQWAKPIDASRNLYQITPQLYRGAQPEQADVPRLQALGIRTIINFRAQHDDQDIIQMPGVKFVHIPMNTWHIETEDIIAALRAIEQAQKDGPVLIHCQHGADRTGVVSAMYRMVEQDWTREQASRELHGGNFGFHGMWVNIPHYLKEADIQRVRAAVHANDPANDPAQARAPQ